MTGERMCSIFRPRGRPIPWLRALLFMLTIAVTLAACAIFPAARQPAPATTPSPTPLTTLPPARYGATTRTNVAYGPLAQETLDLCQPAGASGPRPGVVLIHPGGFSAGGASDLDPICSYLASEGFIAASINYRLAPASPWPAELVDAQLAVRWLRSQATALSLDPHRLCSFGLSAGALLAVFLGELTNIHPGDEAALLTGESPQTTCIVDDFGPVDIPQILSNPADQQTAQSLLGGTPQTQKAVEHDASPIFFVSSATAPTLIVQGTRDVLVPPSQSDELRRALEQHHVPVQYISYDGGHLFLGLAPQQTQATFAWQYAYLIAQEYP
ncbi:MAG TPA: alpha/beta hydrolase [Ktedonobacterales bacterium]|nr:alpha/beta hydrolase [Ktedonobacterales bacterium]